MLYNFTCLYNAHNHIHDAHTLYVHIYMHDTPHIHVYNVQTQHTSHYKPRAVAEKGMIEGLAYFGKAQWSVYTCMHSTVTPDVPG